MAVVNSKDKRGLYIILILVGFVTFNVCAADRQTALSEGADQQENKRQVNQDKYDLSWERLGSVSEPLLKDSDRRRTVPLSLQDCIARTLEHNLDLRSGSYDPAIRMTDVIQAEAVFDAVFMASAQFETIDRGNIESGYYTRTTQTNTGISTERIPTDPFIQQHDYNYTIALQKLLPTGASLEFAQYLRRLRTDEERLYLNPYYESSLNLELRQPLLRNFGIDVNRASINAARNNVGISQQQFALLAIQTVAEVENNYWTLVYYRQLVKIQECLLAQFTDTNQRLIERKILDTDAAIISRSKAQIAQTQADLLSARNNVKNQQDRLLESINDPTLQVGELWEILPQDEPTMLGYQFDREELLELAMEKRPELIAQRLAMDTTDIAVGVARNRLLPQLDLLLRQEMNAPGGGARPAWSTQNRYDTVNYFMGFSFKIPLGNRAAQAGLTKAKLEQKQEKLLLKSYRQQIRADVNISLDSMQSAYQETVKQRQALNSRADNLRSQLAWEETDAKIDANFLFRKFYTQQELGGAYNALAQKIRFYNLSIISLQRAQGTLLQYYNIKLAESPDEKHTIK